MTTEAVSPVPVALGSAGTDTEEGRAFFQERLGLYAMWSFVLSGTFLVLNFGLALDVAPGYLYTASLWAHLGATATAGLLWGLTRTRPVRYPTLVWLDNIGLVLMCGLFALMGTALAVQHVDFVEDPVHALLLGQMACMTVILARTLAVPSTPNRSFWLALVALVPQTGLSAYALTGTGQALVPPGYDMTSQQAALSNLLNIVAWSGVSLALTTGGARVIFGLRSAADKVKRLGQYTLEEKIGEGGMGTVYKATHAMLRRPTAIKLLSPDKSGEDSIQRFEREVQLTATLSHPSTIAIFDYGRTPAGVFYYAMEYLDGLNLEELVGQDGPQKPSRVGHILTQVAEALTEAHEAGLIHRDIKPANVILCERGGMSDVAKVVDFGLVKSVVASANDATMQATSSSVLTGTPHYMSPEAIKGADAVDGRSDLYALGAVGYFLLAGHPVFQSDNLVEVIGHHLHTAPAPLSAAGLTVPADLEAVLLQCLAKDPAERFATARDLAHALRDCGKTTPWDREHADDWWDRFKTAREHAPKSPGPGTAPPTMVIDLEERCRLSLPFRRRSAQARASE